MARPRGFSLSHPAVLAFVAFIAGLAVVVPRSAHADELPPAPQATTSLLVGAGIATASFGTGMTMTGTSGDGFVQNAGIVTAQSGLVVAPFVAHGVAGEWKRGLLFALPPLATEIGMAVLIGVWGESLVTLAPLGTQYLYSALFTGSVFFSAIGIVDSAFAGDRAAAATRAPAPASARAWVLPAFDRNGVGLKVGGLL
ncbi:MAG: hypothetical protein JWO86_899 [Myxococcaceae bacterium]|nr:hypothetical protein [Myxococcaceae bacterium]